jgi:hypothetical protein
MRRGLGSRLMFDVAMLSIAAGCFICIFALFWALERI